MRRVCLLPRAARRWQAFTPVVAACALVFLTACSAGEETHVPTLTEGTVRVMTREQQLVDVSTTEPIKLGKNDLLVTFPPPLAAELVRASALMPAHGHGSKPPTIERTEEGYRVRDLVFYMSGRWEVRFGIRAGEREDEALLTVDVP
ncbi:MAG: hypothetical protein KF819_37330 [Labilithrix sp.]|nr:hypothetical protein [Labilithrix sp.]